MIKARSSVLAVVSVLVLALLAGACGSGNDVTETDATETNFFVPACYSDADCPGGRCQLHEEQPAPDSGAPRGRCVND
jgi:hypothetical protein